MEYFVSYAKNLEFTEVPNYDSVLLPAVTVIEITRS